MGAADEEDELPVGPGTRIGPYRVEEFLARGGMGMLVRAVDEKLGRKVAVKLILPRFAAEADFRARFERECRVLAAISHPNVVTVYYFDVWQGAPFYAMELIQGVNLDQLAGERRGLSWKEAAGWMVQCCEGLEAAREQGIIHRDLKPANILLDRTGRIRIVDFGLAKQSDLKSQLTGTAVFVGTPHYVSPEQAKGTAVDWRADVYSLGATFYHLLAGRTVFDAPSAMEVVAAHIREAPVPLAEASPGVPRELAALIDRMLAKDPAARVVGAGYPELAREIAGLEARIGPEAGATLVGRRVPVDPARAETVAGTGSGAGATRMASTPGGAGGALGASPVMASGARRAGTEPGGGKASNPALAFGATVAAEAPVGLPAPVPRVLGWLKAPPDADPPQPEVGLLQDYEIPFGSRDENPIFVLDDTRDRQVSRRHGAFAWAPAGYELKLEEASLVDGRAGIPAIRMDGGEALGAGRYRVGAGTVLELNRRALLRLSGSPAGGLRVEVETRVRKIQEAYGGKFYWVLMAGRVLAGAAPEAGIRLDPARAPARVFWLVAGADGLAVEPVEYGLRLDGAVLEGPGRLAPGSVLEGPGFCYKWRPVADPRALWEE